jgi:hypothetical protein
VRVKTGCIYFCGARFDEWQHELRPGLCMIYRRRASIDRTKTGHKRVYILYIQYSMYCAIPRSSSSLAPFA